MTDPTYNFGMCPECFKEGRWDEEQYGVNVQNRTFAICKHHKTAWCMVWNASCSWTHENQELWDKNLEMLEQEYKTVEPVHPQKFLQIDGWCGDKREGDSMVATDEKGYSMTAGVTFELMHGADVRIFLAPSTTASEAASLLRQAADWLDREPNLFQDLIKYGDDPFLRTERAMSLPF